MPTTTVPLSGGDAEVHYGRSGDGPGLVLVHGTAASSAQWLPLANALSDRFTVVVPDLSGSGATRDHGGPLTVEDLAAEVLAAAEHAGLGAFHVAGHSMGAVVAAHLAATRPEKVLSLAMHAGWVKTDTRMAAEFRSWLATLRADAEHGTTLFARLLPLMAFGPGYWAATTDEANEALVGQLTAVIEPGAIRHTEVDLRVDLGPLLGRITAPALVLASAHDRLIDAAQQRELASRIAGARYAELDAGHGAPAEVPEAFGEALAAFFDSQRLAAASAR